MPPKDPYIQVRVLDDIGEVLLTDRSANLACYSMHFLRRTDAEPYISQVGLYVTLFPCKLETTCNLLV